MLKLAHVAVRLCTCTNACACASAPRHVRTCACKCPCWVSGQRRRAHGCGQLAARGKCASSWQHSAGNTPLTTCPCVAPTCAQAHKHTCPHAHSHARTRINVHARTHMCASTHTQMRCACVHMHAHSMQRQSCTSLNMWSHDCVYAQMLAHVQAHQDMRTCACKCPCWFSGQRRRNLEYRIAGAAQGRRTSSWQQSGALFTSMSFAY